MAAIRIGTRPSRLAMKQAELVSGLLKSSGHETSLVAVSSSGDIDRATPLYESKGTGIFVEEVNRAVLDGRTDVAVHSAKDLPSVLPDELEVLGVLPREDPSDVLIAKEPLVKLPRGAVIGTSSMRRIRELLMIRGDLKTANLRGNLDTRVGKVSRGEYDGIIVARAGLNRLSIMADIQALSLDDFLPAPNQGIIAIVGKRGTPFSQAVEEISHRETMEIYRIERHIVSSLNLGCSMPVGILCTRTDVGYRLKCRFYSNSIREFKEFSRSFSGMDAVEDLISDIRERVPESYGYGFRKAQ